MARAAKRSGKSVATSPTRKTASRSKVVPKGAPMASSAPRTKASLAKAGAGAAKPAPATSAPVKAGAGAAKPAPAKPAPAKARSGVAKRAPATSAAVRAGSGAAKRAPATSAAVKAALATSVAAKVVSGRTKASPTAKPAPVLAVKAAPLGNAAPTGRAAPIAKATRRAATGSLTKGPATASPTRSPAARTPKASTPPATRRMAPTARAVAATPRITPARTPKASAATTSRIKPDAPLTTRPATTGGKPSAAAVTGRASRGSLATTRDLERGIGRSASRAGTGAPARRSTGAPRKPTSAEVVESIVESLVESTDAVPLLIGSETSAELARRSLTARERALRSTPVVEILDDPHPIEALRRFLDSVKGAATPQQAQIALGSAQLMLVDFEREHRGGAEVQELVDLVLRHWDDFGDRRRGFHAQEFLRNALAAIGVDRERIAQLEALIPEHATSELLFNLACAHAVARDKVAMLRAVERALEAGASAGAFRRDPDLAPYTNDPDVALLLARAEIPPIPVHLEPYLPGVRAALDALVRTLNEFGESIELRPPVRLDTILDAERAGRISLPNDYRALLTITNGMRLWEHEFFSAGDYREPTRLAVRARQYLASNLAVPGLVECVPLASWGQPGDWLLYDPRGRLRAGLPGYVLFAEGAEILVDDLVTALAHMENLAREVLGTN